MTKQPIHQNLSTTFVDIDALVSYLRGLQFVGSIRLELCNYEAEIIFTPTNKLQARELDSAIGVSAQGEAAFRRILIRAREPHGRLHVYQNVSPSSGRGDGQIHIDAAIATRAKLTVSSSCDTPATHLLPRCGPNPEATDDWDVLLNLTSELLRTVDYSLQKGGMSFTTAFENACGIIAEEFPFIDPNRGLFEYRNGNVRVMATVSREQFISAVLHGVSRIFDRLQEEPTLRKVYNFTSHRVGALVLMRKDVYTALGLAPGVTALLKREILHR